jgi:hypothetical protein
VTDHVGAELVATSELLDVSTGEVLPATLDNAAKVLHAAREMKDTISNVIAAATDYLASEASRQGIKTFHVGRETITVSGGTSIDYDAIDLMDALRVAGCPEDRINAAVEATITYKVNRAVLRQLAAANPDYRAAVELAERPVEKPYRASIRRQT